MKERAHGSSSCRWEGNIKMDLKEMGCELDPVGELKVIATIATVLMGVLKMR
jgi:hypothetical protein